MKSQKKVNESGCFFELNPIRYERANTNGIILPKTIKIKTKKPLTKIGLIHAVEIITNPERANFFESKILQKLTRDFINKNEDLFFTACDEWDKSGIRIKIPFEFGLYEVEKMIVFDFLCRQKPVQSKIFQIVDSICKKALLFNIKIVSK